jgi:hypothetical protein
MRIASLVIAIAVGLSTVAIAQQGGHHHHGQPYAALADRPIKALTPDQISDLEAGRGMGLSLPAELNGYPGPKHVLELAGELALDDSQRTKTEVLMAQMSREAIAAGAELIAREQQLEARFADKSATAADVQSLVIQIGSAQAKLRAVHLNAHLGMRDILTSYQITRYAALRGYTPSNP